MARVPTHQLMGTKYEPSAQHDAMTPNPLQQTMFDDKGNAYRLPADFLAFSSKIHALNCPSEELFDGSDYVAKRDNKRLTAQMERIFNLMQDGQYRTLREISDKTGDPEASISAQLRHLRKPRFGGHTLKKKYLGNGLYSYQLVVYSPQA